MPSEKPSLVLHPGLPKCATSSIQRAFVIQDHALARQLRVACIGKKFLPNNGHPAVSELMYDSEGSRQLLLTNDYPMGRYFMSNEAVASDRQFLDLLGQRFDIRRIVVTVRFPPLQALSNYRYSGWLRGNLAQVSVTKDAGCYAEALERFVVKMQIFAAHSDTVIACPTERLDEPLLDRFCRICFDTVPTLLSQPQYSPTRRQNQSIPWAFAHALWQQVSRVDPAVVKAWTRSTIVKAAQNYPLPEHLTDRRAPGPDVLDGDRLRATLPAYHEFLRANGVPDDIADSTLRAAQQDLEKLLQTPPASDAEMKIFTDAAKDVVSQMNL